MSDRSHHRRYWRWWVCALLLFASTINYMDRQTLSSAAARITLQFRLSQEQYGNLEFAFGVAFAVGSLLFGLLADRFSIRLLYPAVLTMWSIAGFLTGFVESYEGLLWCRGLLGFFEAGHWPCALKTTQRLLAPGDRAMGNSVLQSGTSLGAVVTPLVMMALLTTELSSWRAPFQVVGIAGLLWVVIWFLSVKSSDLQVQSAGIDSPGEPGLGGALWGLVRNVRFWILRWVVICINSSWQVLRAWLPKFLQEGRGYLERDVLGFTSVFYVATDLGCLGAGALTLWLVRRGMVVHRSRSLVFFGCACLTASTTLVPFLPKGGGLLFVLLLAGAGALGLFPCYYAMTQELSSTHQGLVTGLMGAFAWAFSAPVQKLFGRLVDRTQSFDLGLACAGWTPMLAFLALWMFWPAERKTTSSIQDSNL